MSMGGMVDLPPVRPDSVSGPRLRFIMIAVAVIVCLLLGAYLVALAVG